MDNKANELTEHITENMERLKSAFESDDFAEVQDLWMDTLDELYRFGEENGFERDE